MSTITFPAADLATKIDLCWSVTGEGKGGTAFRELFPDSGAHLVVRFWPLGWRMSGRRS